MRSLALLICFSAILSGQIVSAPQSDAPALVIDTATGRRITAKPDPGSLVLPSPDRRNIAFVRGNNLWISSAKGSGQKALTRTGGHNLLVGIPDLVYGREFDVDRHFWWAPDSSSIAFIETQFQDENHYVIPGGNLPAFRLKIINISTGEIVLVAESDSSWAYLLRVNWSPDSRRLIFYRMNRSQNQAELFLYHDGTLTTLLTEKDAYWVNAPETPVFVGQGRRIVISSERSGNKHVYLYELDGKLVRDLTPPDLEVCKLHQTQALDHIYVSGSRGTHQEQQLFRLNLDDIVSEQITKEPGWHEVSLSLTGNAYLDCYSSSMTPPSVKWHGPGNTVRAFATATVRDAPVQNEFFTIKTHDNVELPARLFKPEYFRAGKKYPVILYTFSGPRGHVVADSWGDWQMAWNRSMVRQGFLVLAVDVRGSGGYGHLFEEYIHYRLGAQETADLREVVNFLRRQSYVGPDRLGIWGCDYGAHTVVHAMWQFPGGFKAGFADSPISDWTRYDAYFTERYLGMPASRFNEYNDSTALRDARKMTGTLLVTARGGDPLIQPEQLEELKKAIAKVRSSDVRDRFRTLTRPKNLHELMANMTEFFKQTL